MPNSSAFTRPPSPSSLRTRWNWGGERVKMCDHTSFFPLICTVVRAYSIHCVQQFHQSRSQTLSHSPAENTGVCQRVWKFEMRLGITFLTIQHTHTSPYLGACSHFQSDYVVYKPDYAWRHYLWLLHNVVHVKSREAAWAFRFLSEAIQIC